MLSRIFWVGIAGIALLTGMVLQDGDSIFGWDDRVTDRVERAVDRSVDRTIDGSVDRTVDRVIDGSIDRMDVVTIDGREVNVTSEQKRAMADAIGGLVKAETSLALMKARGGGEEEIQAATAERDRLRAEVDRIEGQMKQQGAATRSDRDAVRDQIRDDVRDTVRDAVRN